MAAVSREWHSDPFLSASARGFLQCRISLGEQLLLPFLRHSQPSSLQTKLEILSPPLAYISFNFSESYPHFFLPLRSHIFMSLLILHFYWTWMYTPPFLCTQFSSLKFPENIFRRFHVRKHQTSRKSTSYLPYHRLSLLSEPVWLCAFHDRHTVITKGLHH